ncbi:universal stress protein [Kineococcus sp. SYSU DK005]|uniref:universal stress protein n=1 Tax=Kineococcus sp. SYSU DK005 TaxID=3383126 RepID=UPI003D7CE284
MSTQTSASRGTTGEPGPARVVVAVTDRPEGEAALAWAVERARTTGAGLEVVFVNGDAPSSPVHATSTARGAAERAAAGAGVAARLHDPHQDVAEQLIGLSAGADVLVLPVRRRSATMKFLLGSIAQRVIGEAACPVVTVKAG